MSERIKSYYENYDEEGRLFRDNAHLPEYLTTIRYFDKLFAPGSRILDACAGTGKYSFYLAEKGHSVTACDLAEHHIGVEGLSFLLADKVNAANTADFEKWMEFIYKHCEEPSILGCSAHGLLIGRKT